jgi:hypothetical protein
MEKSVAYIQVLSLYFFLMIEVNQEYSSHDNYFLHIQELFLKFGVSRASLQSPPFIHRTLRDMQSTFAFRLMFLYKKKCKK